MINYNSEKKVANMNTAEKSAWQRPTVSYIDIKKTLFSPGSPADLGGDGSQ